MKKRMWIIMMLWMPLITLAQKTVRYDLYVRDTIVNFTGKERQAFSVNGSIPMPELHFTEGDTAEIWVHNESKKKTSIHWHGVILPNEQDGVPYLTTAPIPGGTTHLYKFPIVQNGTYWYHSHMELQEQNGMYGAFIIHKKEETKLPEYTIVLSDWTDMKPFEVHRRLHMANDWSAIKKAVVQKGAVQSYADAIAARSLKTKFGNEWKRMLAMDVSDVYYDKLLTNGRSEDEVPAFKAGDRIRVRIINGSSSSYFWIRYSGGKMNVVASDGMDVVPVPVDRFIIAVSETYDVILTIPSENTAFELQATSEDRIRSTSLWLGTGIKQLISPLEPLKYFEGMQMMNDMIKMDGNLDDMGMNMSLQQMDMNVVMYPEITGSKKKKKQGHKHMDMADGKQYKSNELSEIVTLNYNMLRSPVKTTLPEAKTTVYHFELTGNMNRYVWSINNKTVSEADKILIRKGENVRIIIYNNSMMRHPMHLHGHFFRVLNENGDYSPLKNVLDIMPMETDTIEFAATESGDWFFHCHILYHMMSGMGRIFSYENSPPNPQLPNPEKSLKKLYADDREFHFMFLNDFATNGNDGEMMLQNTRWSLQAEWRLGYSAKMGYETEVHMGRYIGKMQWFMPYVGLDWRYRRMESGETERNLFGQVNTHNQRTVLCAGIQYTLPMLIVADVRIDTDGKFRLQLMREDIPLTKRLRLGLMYNSDFEYMAGLKYILNKSFSLSAHYDSDMGFGGGFTFTY
ncbi:multicopper oxidase domain-containing protein [Fluviicola chungangensis]|uniref:Copper oxidase n=1 Tax=Fluviicola chungangensis TaxID=2597671 RepID=A0A556MMZ7_9FLAO|nr:multicopper oxidase domain-containing protein [Fluviicola chungangensis]TSJ41317.1 copper oxidase [Fluviicola chungangensis]